jgi:hypothetical protein
MFFSKLSFLVSCFSLVIGCVLDFALWRLSIRMDGFVIMAKTWIWVVFLTVWWLVSLLLALWVRQRWLTF